MSWDIVIFSSKQKIDSIEEINEELFIDIDFDAILEKHFSNIVIDDNHRRISGENYSIEYFTSDAPASGKLFSLYGQSALFELIKASKIYGWQIFDTGNGQMLDLDHPEKNGYNDFQSYLNHVLNQDNKSEQ